MTYLSAAKMAYIDVKTVSVGKETVIKTDIIRNSFLFRQHSFVAFLHVSALCWFCYKFQSALTIHYLCSVGVSPKITGIPWAEMVALVLIDFHHKINPAHYEVCIHILRLILDVLSSIFIYI